MPTQVMTTTTTISLEMGLTILGLVVGVVSIIQGIISLWLSVHFKREADAVNQRTTDLLMDVKTDAKMIARATEGELQRWGDVARQHMMMAGTVTGTTTTGLAGEPVTSVVTSRDITTPEGSKGASDASN